MCDICRQTPCHPRCPNAPEPKPVERCCLCGEGIYEGDEYLITTDGCVCKDCLEDFSINQWLELIGESLTTAEREEEQWQKESRLQQKNIWQKSKADWRMNST